MDIQTLSSFLFILLMVLFIYWKRKEIQVQKILFPILYFVMYKTSLGIIWMDKVAKKCPNFWKKFYTVGIYVGFLGMIFISFEIIRTTFLLITQPDSTPGIMPVLPFEAKGVFFVPFFYWIISVFVIAVIHEFSHGVAARAYNMHVKSSGFAFLSIIAPIIPAAFVEPDEKQLQKRPHKEQLSVFAAGPFANIVLSAILLLVIFSIVQPISEKIFKPSGVLITEIAENSPSSSAGLKKGEVITKIDLKAIEKSEDFTNELKTKKPGDSVTIYTNVSSYPVTLGTNAKNHEKAYLGVFVKQHSVVRDEFAQQFGTLLITPFSWFAGLLFWLFILSLGIGLFNLLPLGPVDGGRMFQLAMHKFFEKDKGNTYWKYVSMFFAFLIIANMVAGFIK